MDRIIARTAVDHVVSSTRRNGIITAQQIDSDPAITEGEGIVSLRCTLECIEVDRRTIDEEDVFLTVGTITPSLDRHCIAELLECSTLFFEGDHHITIAEIPYGEHRSIDPCAKF